jgi:dTDP-D-glucose 4,6-dehydratase
VIVTGSAGFFGSNVELEAGLRKTLDWYGRAADG